MCGTSPYVETWREATQMLCINEWNLHDVCGCGDNKYPPSQQQATVGVLMINNVDGHVLALYALFLLFFVLFHFSPLCSLPQSVLMCHICCYSNTVCFMWCVSSFCVFKGSWWWSTVSFCFLICDRFLSVCLWDWSTWLFLLFFSCFFSPDMFLFLSQREL